MAMESDCVSFQTSLPSSDVSDSSVLSTPELTPPSSCASSTDGSEHSFFSALSSNNSDALPPAVGIRKQGPIVDSPISEMGFPQRVDFPSKMPSIGNRRPSPLPLDDFTVAPSSPASHRPRKLRKSRPFVPKLSLDSILSSIPGSSQSPSSPTPLSRHQKPLLTSPIIPRRTITPEAHPKRSRRSSLPTIPSATFFPAAKWNSDELEEVESGGISRAVRFLTPLGSNSKPLHAPRSPHPNTLTRNASTHALVSLAWTGQIPSSIGTSHFALSSVGSTFDLPTPASGCLTSLGSARRSTWSEEDEDTFETSPISSRLRTLQRYPSSGRTRRWTLAMAITNDEITDEMFMDEVEKMRSRGKFWESRKSLDSPSSPRSPVGPAITSPTNSTSPPQLKHALPCLSDPLLSATWQTARRALLICRELIRTERNYLASLFVLISNGTASPAPALMLTYMPALVQVSEDLLLRMEANPSAQGVAEAFLEGESRLEAAFVAWCGVAGGFFAGVESQAVRDRAASTSVLRETDSPITMPLKRRVTTWVQGRRNSFVKSRENLPSFPSGKHNERPRAGRSLPSVRDLAILPTQRVMRYALLFKDLLAHIPSSSPSHAFVERAMRASVGIAQKADRAQGNAAFLHQPV